jgi:hypothetical protein
VGVAKHKTSRGTLFPFLRIPGSSHDTGPAYRYVCGVEFYKLLAVISRSRIVKSSQVKSSKQVKLLAAGAHSIPLDRLTIRYNG